MQIIKLDLSHHNFFCPVTGQRITSYNSYQPSPALAAMWHSEIVDMPEIYNAKLEKAWEKYSEKVEQDNDYLEVADFIVSNSIDNLICFEFTTHGMACGPVSSTVWYVIDMDYEADDESA